MAGVPRLLLEVLEELLMEDLRKFQFFLCNDVTEGFPTIARGRVSGLDRVDTVQLLVQTYGHDDAVTVTADKLMKMQNRQLCEQLMKEYKEGKAC